MKNFLRSSSFLCIAIVLSACGREASSPKKPAPEAALYRYATELVQKHKPLVHGHSAPMQTLESPLSYVTQFFTDTPAMATTPDQSAYEKNIGITNKWQEMYCTDELKTHLRENGIAIASAHIIASSTGQRHSVAMCLAT